MSVMAVVVIWIVIGVLVAVFFGFLASRGSRLHGDDEELDRSGADIRYLRRKNRTAAETTRQESDKSAKKRSGNGDTTT